jgi:hypothetical protein
MRQASAHIVIQCGHSCVLRGGADAQQLSRAWVISKDDLGFAEELAIWP